MAAEAIPAFLYAPEIPEPGGVLRFAREDAHYLVRVCRLRAGEQLSVTDGRGRLARVRFASREGAAHGEVESVETVAAPAGARLLCGAPEGERADWLVEKLAELGVTDLVPVDCERASWERFAKRVERLRRVAIAALRQSRRAHLLAIHPVSGLREALEGIPAGGERWLASEAGGQAGPTAPGLSQAGLVGPAPGLTAAETASCDALGFRPISLAGARLRTETAAVALAAWWAFRARSYPGIG